MKEKKKMMLQERPVIQSNPLINAHYKLDLIEQKVLRYIISLILPEDKKFSNKYYRIYMKELKNFLNWSENSGSIFNYIKNIADKLKLITVKIIKPDTTIITSWIASYEFSKNEGWIEFEFSSKLESELLKLKSQFTKYYLNNIKELKSQYSIRLYELLKQHIFIGRKKFYIDELRDKFLISDLEYKLFGDFNKRVLKKSIKEILEKTDLTFQTKYIKEKNKIVAILFYNISQKKHISKKIIELIPKNIKRNSQLLKIISTYLEQMGEEYIIEKINYTNSKNPQSWIDYFFCACQQNWGANLKQEQLMLPKYEEIKDGTKIEIDGKIHTFNYGAIHTKDGVIPIGPLYKMITEGKAKIVTTPPNKFGGFQEH